LWETIDFFARNAAANVRIATRVETGKLLIQLGLKAILQFWADFGDFHAWAHQEFAAQEFMGAVFIGEFSNDAAILAVLIPAETPVWNGLRTDVLEAAKNRVLLWNLKSFPHDLNFDQPFVGSKNLSATT
jgi:hypothetical protein